MDPQNPPMPPDANDLDPELIRQAMSLFTAQQKNPLLANQLAQAQALQKPQENQYGHTPWGAALGGAAGAVDRVSGAYQARKIGEQQIGNIANQQDTLNQIAQALALRARGKQAPPAPVSMDPGD